ncbi:MAG: hypothetical protein RLZ32_3089 [Gemmatimonadota bacterium]
MLGTPDPSTAPPAWRPLEPAVIRLWRTLWLVEGVGVALLAATIASRMGATPRWGLVAAAAGIPLGVAVLLALRLPPRRHAAWRVALGEEALLVHRGVLVRVESVIPYSRIQHVDYTQGPLARLYGLASVVVRTASADGGAVRIPGLRPDDAVALREALAARAGMVEPL